MKTERIINAAPALAAISLAPLPVPDAIKIAQLLDELEPCFICAQTGALPGDTEITMELPIRLSDWGDLRLSPADVANLRRIIEFEVIE